MAGDSTYHLVIASVGQTLFDGRAQSATFPGTAGEFGVLPHHEALVTTLKAGTIRVKDHSGSIQAYEIVNGVLECANNRVVVLL
jgi:F-type H+-transporting ATPase subunit epsilon